jgi:hypothetical protein
MLSSSKETGVHFVRHGFRVWFLAFLTAGLMTGCALSPENNQSESQQDGASKAPSADALSDTDLCACDSPIATDHFDAALQQLAVGDYEAARESLTQHGASGLDQASQESNVGLDLIDAIAAQNLEPNSDEADPVSARGSALRLLLALIVDLQNQIAEAEADNAQMRVELEKREEALKRLRELTLGQPES